MRFRCERFSESFEGKERQTGEKAEATMGKTAILKIFMKYELQNMHLNIPQLITNDRCHFQNIEHRTRYFISGDKYWEQL